MVELLSTLHRDLWTDVEVKSKDGGSVNAHRSILAMHSHRISALFHRAERLKTPNIIELPLSFDCLELVMQLIYRGVVEVDSAYREEFVEFIDLYYFKHYTGECISFLRYNVV